VIAQNMPPLGPACVVLAALVLLPWMYYAGGFAQLRQWSAQRWLGMVAGATGVFGYAASSCPVCSTCRPARRR
jgi:hypothetical protein